MSYCELKIVNADGDVVGDTEYSNAHGFGPFVWGALVRKYRRALYPNDPIMSPTFRSPFDEWGDLWEAVREGKLSVRPWEHMVLHFTYDRNLVHGRDIDLLARALHRFEDAHAVATAVSHLGGMASRLLQLDCRAACVYGMSVSDDLWWVNSADEEEEGRPYNIDRDHEHGFIDPRPFGP